MTRFVDIFMAVEKDIDATILRLRLLKLHHCGDGRV